MDAISTASTMNTKAWKEEPWLRDFPHVMRLRFSTAFRQHPVVTICVASAVPFVLFVFRHDVQLLLLFVRIYGGGLMFAILFASGIWWWLRRYSARIKTLGGIFAIIITAAVVLFGPSVHEYIAQYLRYETMSVTDLTELPTTTKERVLPMKAVQTLARDRMNLPEMPSLPNLVRVGDENRWTMALEPNKFWGRLTYAVERIISIPASDPSPDFGSGTAPVYFTAAEKLFLGRNTETCVRRTFGFWRSISYQPANIFYLPDDSGRMVEVVSLIKWTGVLFPWPEFGGVQVIEQTEPRPWYEELFVEAPKHVLFGCGQWIAPDQVTKHPFLVGQNIVPHAVSHFRAESLRFQGGDNWFERFFAPMPFSRQGDIVIADVPEDMNPQPFVLFFKMKTEDKGKLYQYFSMETRDLETHGISASFWYPADGIGPIYAYRYAARGERLIGVTALRDRVMASKRNYNWGSNLVGEARPYIHPIADAAGNVKSRFLYMVTLVTFTRTKTGHREETRFTVGGNPEIAMVDASREKVVWVDTYHPEKWDEQIREELGSMWVRK